MPQGAVLVADFVVVLPGTRKSWPMKATGTQKGKFGNERLAQNAGYNNRPYGDFED